MRRAWHLALASLLLPACGGSSGGSSNLPAPGGILLWEYTSSFSPDADRAYAVATDGTHAYIAGQDSTLGLTDARWRVEKRAMADGAPAPGFGAAGVLPINPSGQSEWPSAIAVDSTALYVGGFDVVPGNPDARARIEKRDLITGGPVGAFGTGGVLVINPGPATEQVVAIAIDPPYMYVLIRDEKSGLGDWQWRIEKRNLADGGTVAAFDGDGALLIDPTPFADRPVALSVDTSYVYAAGVDYVNSSDFQWRIEKRDKVTGAPVTSLTHNPSTMADGPVGMTIDGTSMYVVGYDSFGAPPHARLEKRWLSDLSLDVAFGTSGVLSFAGPTALQAIASDANFLYVGGAQSAWLIERRRKDTGAVDGWSAVTLAGSVLSIALDSTRVCSVGYVASSGDEWHIETRLK